MNKTLAFPFAVTIIITAAAIAPCCMAMQNPFGGTYLGTYSGEHSSEFSALPSITFSPNNESSWSSYYVGDETYDSFLEPQGNYSAASPSGLFLYNSGNLTLGLTASAQVAYQDGYAQYSYQALTLVTYKASWLEQPVVIYYENISSPNTLSTVSYNLSLANIPEGHQQIIVTANEQGYIASGMYGAPLNSMNYTSFSASTSAVFNFNVVPPFLSVTSPAEGQVFDSSEIPLDFNVNEASTVFAYSLDNLAKYDIGGNTTISGFANGTALTNGHYSLTVYAGEDSFGNIGKSQTINFTIAEPEPTPEPTRPFPVATVAVISVAAVAIVGIGLAVLFYRRRHRKTSKQNQ